MRAAPPVEVVSALRDGWWAAAIGLWLSCAACVVAWWLWHAVGDGATRFSADLPLMLPINLLAVGTLAAAGALLWHAHQIPMRLSWNGSHWVCTPLVEVQASAQIDAAVGDVDLMLDFGDALLLRWRALAPAPGRVTWLPVSRALQPAAWHALRVALSQPTPAALPRAGAAR